MNVDAQRRDPGSFMSWLVRLIRVRKECMELAWGKCEVLETKSPSVLALCYEFRGASMVTLHNFDEAAQTVSLRLKLDGGERLVDLIGEEHSDVVGRNAHEIVLDGYGYRWFRVGVVDETLSRKPF